MTGRIDHWDRKYRARQASAGARLDALGGAVLAAYEQALAAADVAGVVVVRQVRAALVVPADDRDDAALAKRWGQAMAAAVLKALATGDPEQVARFDSPADHLAAFLAAAADGRPTDHWSFDRFGDAVRETPGDTLAAALLARPELAPQAVARLHALGAVGRVVAALGPRAGRVWAEAVAGTAAPPPAAERPVFAAALAVAARLGAHSPTDAERWFAEYVARPRPATDWTDRTHLAEAVAAAVRFVLTKSPLSRVPTPEQVVAAVAQFDWVDAEWLARRLTAQLIEASPSAATKRGPSPRQREWAAAVRAAVPHLSPALRRTLGSPEAALAVFAAVAADRPEWAADPAFPAFVAHTLAAVAAETLAAVEAPPLIESVPPPGWRLDAPPSVIAPPVAEPSVGIPTAAGGVFLLLRAAYDLRLLAAARRSGFPGDGAERLALAWVAAAWAGVPWTDPPDPGLLLVAGLDPDSPLPQEGDAGERAADFLSGMLHAVVGHRLIDPGRMAVAVVHDPAGGWLAFAGDDTADVWPLAAPIESPEAIPADEWSVTWEAITGSTPTVERMESERLAAALVRLGTGPFADRRVAAAVTAAGLVTLRAWTRWLRPFAGASAGYLLDQFVRRPGVIIRADGNLTVAPPRRPLDVGLAACGGLDPFDLPPGAVPKGVRFLLTEGGG